MQQRFLMFVADAWVAAFGEQQLDPVGTAIDRSLQQRFVIRSLGPLHSFACEINDSRFFARD
jgi:hypothetical protein